MPAKEIIQAPDSTEGTVHDRRWLTLAVLCLSLFVIVMDNTIVNVALPTLVRDLGTSTSQLQWVVDSYTLVFAGLLLAAGSRQPRRSLRTPGSAQHRARHLRWCVGGRGVRRRGRCARRFSRRDGRRRGADHAGDVVDPHQRLHRCP
jgi:MFS family permease